MNSETDYNTYTLLGKSGSGDKISSQLLAGFGVAVDEVFGG